MAEKNFDTFGLLTVLVVLMIAAIIGSAMGTLERADTFEVTVTSRAEVPILCNNISETQVVLKFSDGSTWFGSPSNIPIEQNILLFLQEGDVIYYRLDANNEKQYFH